MKERTIAVLPAWGVSPLASLAGPVDATGVTLQEEEEEEKKKMFDLKLESLLQRPCHQDQDHQGGEDLYRPEVEGAREEEELLLWDSERGRDPCLIYTGYLFIYLFDTMEN
ncbi:hypothetical protein B296_00027150 [Ensete ventricosum]|uniref:Uncharacterized protein n=1 Tax=Ensete ventricosum TaxID=4639 RepID=A0A427AFU4_ENSVE|nr:hypothetical protein B296_00027150 [Ensete ventricosum]